MASLSRLRAISMAALLVILALVDAALLEFGWPLLIVLGAAGLAALGRTGTDDTPRGMRRRNGAAVCASALSVGGTIVIAGLRPEGSYSFGLVEALSLLLLVVPQWRFAVSRLDKLRAFGVVISIVVLPARLLSPDSIIFALGLAALSAVAIAAAVALRAQDEARQLAVAAVRRTEREDIARELHDMVAHHVTGIIVATQAARTVTAGTGGVTTQVDACLRNIESAGTEAMAAMRHLVSVLRTPEESSDLSDGGAHLQPTPTLTDLPQLVRRFALLQPGMDVQLRPSTPPVDELTDLSAGMQASLYRVVQEGLTNVTRHAPSAATVSVQVTATDETVSVEVINSRGAVETPSPPEGRDKFGLVGMGERMAVFGGSVDAGPDHGGWRVTATAPRPLAARRADPLR
jgi:signal transduction histidine kinase